MRATLRGITDGPGAWAASAAWPMVRIVSGSASWARKKRSRARSWLAFSRPDGASAPTSRGTFDNRPTSLRKRPMLPASSTDETRDPAEVPTTRGAPASTTPCSARAAR